MSYFQDLHIRFYVDGTLGAGGHASALVRRHPEVQTVVGFDLDPSAHQIASKRLQDLGLNIIPFRGSSDSCSSCSVSPTTKQAILVNQNFSTISTILPQLSPQLSNVEVEVDAMLLDLGISSMQVDTADRGFSFLKDGPLDMRMDPNGGVSAEEAVNTWSEAKIGQIIKEFGEERYWKSIARRIVTAREEESIVTTQQLVKAIGNPGGYGGRGKEKKRIHPATRTFQALRIAVNGELESVALAVPLAIDALAPGGRLAIITFHSLEDRIVKWAFRKAAGMSTPEDEQEQRRGWGGGGGGGGELRNEKKIKILTKRPVIPSDEEQKLNPRSRSAKLRVVEKV